MPGFESSAAVGKNPWSGMPIRLNHPFKGPTGEMNTGRGCDVYGKPYKPPHRFAYLNIHRYNAEVDDYETAKSYEFDFGPSIDSEEFQEGLRKWKESADFQKFHDEVRHDRPEYDWEDPVEQKPWEVCELVSPNPWLTEDYKVEEPIQQHIKVIREWADRPHKPWPSWAGQASLEEGGGDDAAIEDLKRRPSNVSEGEAFRLPQRQ